MKYFSFLYYTILYYFCYAPYKIPLKGALTLAHVGAMPCVEVSPWHLFAVALKFEGPNSKGPKYLTNGYLGLLCSES